MKRIKKKAVIVLLIVLGVLGISVVVGIGLFKYFKSDEYSFKKLGYNEKEITTILKMDKENIDAIKTLEYNEHNISLFEEKYFLLKNFKRYLEYKNKNKDKSYSDVVGAVNVGSDKEWYKDSKPTDMEKEYLILVNKFNNLVDNYSPEDLVTMGLQYAFEGKKIRTEVYDAFKRLVKNAKKEDLTIVANSTFRTFTYQDNLYTRYKSEYGKEYADNYAARPGHSEHQTGLSIDVSTLHSTTEDFEETEEFKWLQEHAHEYGFILRYPKGKEFITGYNYESWHYRYVGEEVAKEIHELGITFDEYYAYFLDK